MQNSTRLKIFLIGTFLTVFSTVFAQVKVGTNPTSINPGSILELESTNQGLLMPRISLTNTTTWGLAGTSVAGMHVYNTNSSITSGNTNYPTLSAKIGEYYDMSAQANFSFNGAGASPGGWGVRLYINNVQNDQFSGGVISSGVSLTSDGRIVSRLNTGDVIKLYL